ncbi:TIGR03619 family F420-dependent LLM class oxidoreductase [Streptomyces sp. RS10V-4]|uniref:TIGR03619 family F420-dependent LLM class oxidoreductase n=1 Tax=Streptomyces rhizoryzae TaxID=2932493 RepID=UPI0020053A71|nr:TIGR03619 family F420-dependent LLM class oxidoreductase [Streptomyces rhizoryzae]MCK7626266.1 TIGR03619 family F420-dependent LLM class oxidoreductase [Streptomyces rhizoryzae]
MSAGHRPTRSPGNDSGEMRLHVVLPSESGAMAAGELAALAREAEELGYAGVWLPDHLLPPGPYGRPPEGYGGVYEALTTLSYLAAVTERVTLGTSVLVAPLREPLLLARQSAALARLSGDRFVLGVGVGWQPYEFAAAGADFRERGARTDRTLRLVRQLHTGAGGPYDDGTVAFDGRAVFEPVPAAPVPFLIGGNSDAALRRAAEFGGYWQGVGLTPDGFAERAAWLARRAAGGAAPVAAGARIGWDGPDRTLAELTAEVAAWQAAGAADLAVWFGSVRHGFADRMRALARGTGVHGGRIAGAR